MKLISHPNVVDLKYYFFCPGERVCTPIIIIIIINILLLWDVVRRF